MPCGGPRPAGPRGGLVRDGARSRAAHDVRKRQVRLGSRRRGRLHHDESHLRPRGHDVAACRRHHRLQRNQGREAAPPGADHHGFSDVEAAPRDDAPRDGLQEEARLLRDVARHGGATARLQGRVRAAPGVRGPRVADAVHGASSSTVGATGHRAGRGPRSLGRASTTCSA